MSSSSARGQTEPLAALAAVFAVAIGLSLYAGVVNDVLPETPDRALAEPTLDRVERVVAPAGVAIPDRLPAAVRRGPDGRHLNVSLATGDRRWTAGPPAPAKNVDRASTQIAVEASPTTVEPGELGVVTWR